MHDCVFTPVAWSDEKTGEVRMSLSIAGRDYIAATVGLTELLVRARVEWLAQETGVAPDVVFKYIRWKRRRIRARMFEADQELFPDICEAGLKKLIEEYVTGRIKNDNDIRSQATELELAIEVVEKWFVSRTKADEAAARVAAQSLPSADELRQGALETRPQALIAHAGEDDEDDELEEGEIDEDELDMDDDVDGVPLVGEWSGVALFPQRSESPYIPLSSQLEDLIREETPSTVDAVPQSAETSGPSTTGEVKGEAGEAEAPAGNRTPTRAQSPLPPTTPVSSVQRTPDSPVAEFSFHGCFRMPADASSYAVTVLFERREEEAMAQQHEAVLNRPPADTRAEAGPHRSKVQPAGRTQPYSTTKRGGPARWGEVRVVTPVAGKAKDTMAETPQVVDTMEKGGGRT